MDAVYANGGEVAASNGMAQAQHVLNWNPKQLDIKTKSVEKTLEPLVLQVSTSARCLKITQKVAFKKENISCFVYKIGQILAEISC